jgi:hypothetical protein
LAINGFDFSMELVRKMKIGVDGAATFFGLSRLTAFIYDTASGQRRSDREQTNNQPMKEMKVNSKRQQHRAHDKSL